MANKGVLVIARDRDGGVTTSVETTSSVFVGSLGGPEREAEVRRWLDGAKMGDTYAQAGGERVFVLLGGLTVEGEPREANSPAKDGEWPARAGCIQTGYVALGKTGPLGMFRTNEAALEYFRLLGLNDGIVVKVPFSMDLFQ